MKKYPTKQSKKRVSSPSKTPKRSRRLVPDSFVMKFRSEDIVAEFARLCVLIQLDSRPSVIWVSPLCPVCYDTGHAVADELPANQDSAGRPANCRSFTALAASFTEYKG
jgi:hypothetical protein